MKMLKISLTWNQSHKYYERVANKKKSKGNSSLLTPLGFYQRTFISSAFYQSEAIVVK